MKTAVLFLVFNRPNTTSEVFKKIRQAKPHRLYVASDGPRKSHDMEKEKVKNVREIATNIDWPCEVKTLFRDKNLGCKKAVSSAITWFFEHEEKGIILEDDCVPHLDFFSFCENLLDFYSDDKKVSVITGSNFQNGKWRGEASYYFSRYNHCWGWATWRRSWKNYDPNIKFWLNWSNSKAWKNFIHSKIERKYWNKIFNLVYLGQIDSWAYPWTASTWYKGGLTLTPNVNLVSNIGFGDNATHTKSRENEFSKMITKDLNNIIYTKKVERNKIADNWTFHHHYGGKKLYFPYNLALLFKKIINKILN